MKERLKGRKERACGTQEHTRSTRSLSCSLTLEVRLALLEKRAQTFGAILGRETLHLLFDFVLQRFGQLRALIPKQNLLHRTARGARSVRYVFRERLRF